MTETFTAVEIARDAKKASTAPAKVRQAGCCEPMSPMRSGQRAKWKSAVLAELAEPGYPERLSKVSEFLARAEFERPAITSGRI